VFEPTLQLGPGNMLCVFTDGVAEAADPGRQLYGRDDRRDQTPAT
jgi:hypothetical protein